MERKTRMPAHRDRWSATLLFKDDCGCLEAESPHKPSVLLPATPVPGACAMDVGEFLMRWSNGQTLPLFRRAFREPHWY